jgi:hypothetical protein
MKTQAFSLVHTERAISNFVEGSEEDEGTILYAGAYREGSLNIVEGSEDDVDIILFAGAYREGGLDIVEGHEEM